MTRMIRQSRAPFPTDGAALRNDAVGADFAAVAAQLPRLRDAFSARLHAGPAPEEVLRLDPPGAELLEAWLGAEAQAQPGADDKLAAAYLLGRIAFAVSEVLAALALKGLRPARLAPNTVALTARRALWHLDGESGEGRAYDVVLSEMVLVPCSAPAAMLGAALPELFAPLVLSLVDRSGLSRGALWRLIGDSFAGALLMQGKHAGREEEAMEMAYAALRDQQNPLHSRQTGFFRIDLPERPDIAEWFRARGGCCRYYTTEGGAYCSTCVLRDPESRGVLLRAHLRRKHGLEEA